VVAIVQAFKTGIGNSSDQLPELQAGKEHEYDDQPAKQQQRLKAVQNNFFRGLVNQVNEKNNDKVYEVTEHRIVYWLIG
jgi:hypothetical protein